MDVTRREMCKYAAGALALPLLPFAGFGEPVAKAVEEAPRVVPGVMFMIRSPDSRPKALGRLNERPWLGHAKGSVYCEWMRRNDDGSVSYWFVVATDDPRYLLLCNRDGGELEKVEKCQTCLGTFDFTSIRVASGPVVLFPAKRAVLL